MQQRWAGFSFPFAPLAGVALAAALASCSSGSSSVGATPDGATADSATDAPGGRDGRADAKHPTDARTDAKHPTDAKTPPHDGPGKDAEGSDAHGRDAARDARPKDAPAADGQPDSPASLDSGSDAQGTGSGCTQGSACASLICFTGPTTSPNGKPVDCPSGGGTCSCQAPTSHDGVKNDSETAVDCGGAKLANGKSNPASDGAAACANGKACGIGSDCTSETCVSGKCVSPSCNDHVKDGDETDVDCGGSQCAPCPTGDACKVGSDCANEVCFNAVITPATASTNGAPISCPAGKSCTCQAPTDIDGVKNDGESGVDCGGMLLANGHPNGASDGAPVCANGQPCVLGTDCGSFVCFDAVITPATASADGSPINCPNGQTCTCQVPTDIDGVKNDSETGVDCGGSNTHTTDGAGPCPAGQGCIVGTDCQDTICFTGATTSVGGQPVDCPAGKTCTCQSASCTDGVKDENETDVDCGGTCSPCPTNDTCLVGTDCQSLICFTGATTSPDGHPVDCPGGTCTCQAPTCSDGVKNASETDIDCGGGTCTACPTADGCLVGTDCQSQVCFNAAITVASASPDGSPINCPTGPGVTCACRGPSFIDGVQNDSETSVDCGGALLASGASNGASDLAPPCAAGSACVLGTDCRSLICYTGPTSATGGQPVNCPGGGCTCQSPSCSDGIVNGSETDVDCGGGVCNPCPDTDKCLLASDCLSGFCSAFPDQATGTCVAGQSCTGTAPGAIAAIMDLTGTTNINGDAIGSPNANGAGQHAGLDTCGIGESTDPVAVQNHESCCRSLVIPSPPAGDAAGERLDKYEVTAGRMRQFIETVNAIETPITGNPYDLYDYMSNEVANNTAIGQRFAAQIPAGVTVAQILAMFPQVYYGGGAAGLAGDDIASELGGTTMDTDYPSPSQGCYTYADASSIQTGVYDGSGANGASTYWFQAQTDYTNGIPGESQVGGAPRPFTQDYYDIKSMNCAPYWIYAAFCAWDGGHVASLAELQAVYGNQTYPWDPPGVSTPLPASYTYYTAPSGNTYQDFVPGTTYCSQDPTCSANNGNAGQPGYNAVDMTMNWNNDSFLSNSGDFYFYPNGQPNGLGGYGVYGYAVNTPPTVTTGWDFSPFIAAPGRFYLDATYIQSPSASGRACSPTAACPAGETCLPASGGTCVNTWQDLGANMLEMTSTLVGGGQVFCDCSTGGYVDPNAPPPPPVPPRVQDPTNKAGCGGNFCCPNFCPYQSYYPVVQAGGTALPYMWWEGGSWEGHEQANPAAPPYFGVEAYNEVLQTQYGKAGFRCARDPEPAP